MASNSAKERRRGRDPSTAELFQRFNQRRDAPVGKDIITLPTATAIAVHVGEKKVRTQNGLINSSPDLPICLDPKRFPIISLHWFGVIALPRQGGAVEIEAANIETVCIDEVAA